MQEQTLFSGISPKETEKLLRNLNAKKMIFKKDRTIATNLVHINMIGIIIEGTANIERYDYNGNRSIIEKLEKNVFGEIFSRLGNDVSVIATSDCIVLFIEYNDFLKNLKNANLIQNTFQMLSSKIIELNKRLEILSKRSIRDKLLTYFLILANESPNRTFLLPFTYTDLADYLSVDRSAMMREIKNLKEEGFLITNGKNITLISY